MSLMILGMNSIYQLNKLTSHQDKNLCPNTVFCMNIKTLKISTRSRMPKMSDSIVVTVTQSRTTVARKHNNQYAVVFTNAMLKPFLPAITLM